jgi:purine-nucleoside phosphorylase
LLGPNEDRWGVRFVDQTEVYDLELRNTLKKAAHHCDVRLVEGVYAAVSGPTYETPAEIRYLQTIGADAVGMSTVPEAIVARHMGLKVAGLSMLANAAAGTPGHAITHDEVLEVAARASADLSELLQSFFEIYGT